MLILVDDAACAASRRERGRRGRSVRFRTVGDVTCTGAGANRRPTRVEASSPRPSCHASPSAAPRASTTRRREASMEERKKREGYF
jgi:hypothetical protein